jgi:ubiquinone/menaquinone biosynthesis C-methylase UbiE
MEYIPVMLVFPTRVHKKFAEKHQQHMSVVAGYTMPAGKPEAGERSVQETFSDEWDKLQDNELSFTHTPDDLVELNRQVWLRPLQQTRDQFKTVLNIGVGLGAETVALQKAVGNAEIFGVDLNFALLQRGRIHRSTPRFHLVIASLFHLPFRPASFDVVYSQGVIHHTYSTRAAFDSIAAFAAAGGQLFIWVYSLDSHLLAKGFKGLALRTKWNLEIPLRPLVSRSPKAVRDAVFAVLTPIFHLLVKMTPLRHKEKWKPENTNHGLRDWLSPRYAHRHSYNQVLEWFEDQGFAVVAVQSPWAFRRLFGKQLYGVGVLGQRIEPIEQAAQVRQADGAMAESVK